MIANRTELDSAVTEELAGIFRMIAAEKRLEKLSREESLNQAQSIGRLGRHAEAERLLIEHLGTWPDDTSARIDLGVSLLCQGKVEEAIDTWEKVRESFPRIPNLYCLLAEAYAKKGQVNTALEILRDGLTRCPDPQSLWYDVATLEDDAGNQKQAKIAYERFLQPAGLPASNERILWARKRLAEL